jgi:DNA invertase Pin-like site-specific DNA recombinase
VSEIKYLAVKYIRNSYADDKQRESDSVENQRKLLEDFVSTRDDIEFVDEFVDDGVSGLIFDRPRFKDMMDAVEAGRINCVIVKDLSRFGRERIETGRYLQRILPSYGVRFIAVNDNIDTLKESADDLTTGVKSIVNEAYCRDISIKTRSALAVKRDGGAYVGACPVYGYLKSEDDKNRLVPDDYASGIVRDIFRMKLEGMSAVKIANHLNTLGVLSPLEYKKDRGLPHPTGGCSDKEDAKWCATTIIRILTSEIYAGTLVQGRMSTLNYKMHNVISKPQAEWVRTEGALEGIVSRHNFDLVQRIMRLDTRIVPGGERTLPFSGILVCGCCGARMTRKSNSYKGTNYYYYRCTTGKKNGCHLEGAVKEETLISSVLESVRAQIKNVTSVEQVLDSIADNRNNTALAFKHNAQIEENERKLDRINSFKSSLFEHLQSGDITQSEYKQYKSKYSEETRILQDAISALNKEMDDILAGTSEHMQWIEHFKQYSDIPELDRKTVVQLISCIRILSKNEIEITFNWQDEFKKVLSFLKREAA